MYAYPYAFRSQGYRQYAGRVSGLHYQDAQQHDAEALWHGGKFQGIRRETDAIHIIPLFIHLSLRLVIV